MLVQVRFVMAAVFLLLTFTVPVAQQRTWLKSHEKIEMDEVLAEYTEIATSDHLSPREQRYLYVDSVGVALVLRHSTDVVMDGDVIEGTGSFGSSVTMVSTGEQITLEYDQGTDTVAVTIASGSFSYSDTSERPLPQSVKVEALGVLTANASPAFQQALQRFAGVGARYSNLFHGFAFELADLFFAEIELLAVTDLTSEPTEIVTDFDPYTTPPGPFEQQFGQAYYE